MSYFNHIPCGDTLPLNNPHAISVSLPTISDVCGYEENNEALVSKLKSAYPRFRMNKLVKQVYDYFSEKIALSPDSELVPVCSMSAVSLIERTIGINLECLSQDDFHFVKIKKNSHHISAIKHLIQHTGLIPSSRRAEKFLYDNHIAVNKFTEEIETTDPEQRICTTLAEAYGNTTPENVYLCNTGMNAMFSVFEALRIAQKKNKSIFVQLGWLYLDTMEIIKKYSDESHTILNIGNLDELENWLKLNHNQIAAVITELPLNPQIKVIDLPLLSSLAKKYDFPVVIDATMATPYNVETLKYADIIVESLTKFASGNADLLMGAVILKNNNDICDMIKDQLTEIIEKPFIADIQRLAASIKGYCGRVKVISDNTYGLIHELHKFKSITSIQSAICNDSIRNFEKIRKGESCLPGVISITFDKALQYYYDKLKLPKGPSFGTEFTLAMPYIYMAHYDLLQSLAGRNHLAMLDIHPDLLRISVGIEPLEELIEVFAEIL